MLASALAAAQPDGSRGAGNPIVFYGDRDQAPFEFLVNGVPRGVNADMVQAIGRVLGREVQLKLTDWGEAQRLVSEGVGDALTSMARARAGEVI